MANLGNIIVFKTYKWELWLSKILPYYLPFMNKRERVRLRQYWRLGGKRRANKAFIKALMSVQYKGPAEWHKIDVSTWEWEVITPKKHSNTKADEQQGVVN